MLHETLGVPADQSILPIMIGAGLNKNFNDPKLLEQYSTAAAATNGAVVVGSITREPREQNEGAELQYNSGMYTLNSWGMNNPGADNVPDNAPHENLILSVAGKTIEEYTELYDRFWQWGLGVELNFGCPNSGNDNRIFSFVPDTMKAVLQYIQQRTSTYPTGEPNKLVGVKLSPYSDPWLLGEVAGMLKEFEGTVDYVATCNTFPNGKSYRKKGAPAIQCSVTKNRGGVGGPALAPISLGQVDQFREQFEATDTSIEIVRVGGVTSGLDLLKSGRSGCSAVQMVSAFSEVGPHYMWNLLQEYEAWTNSL